MNNILLNAYVKATWPLRRLTGLLRARQGMAPVCVLFYHRIADDGFSPWTMTNQCFADQIDWLTDRFDLVSLGEAQRRIASGFNSRPAAVITFDDGYADNCHFALPMLIERGIPCTYFVTLQNVQLGTPFPHDVKIADENLQPTPAPNTIEQLREIAAGGIEIGGHTRTHPNLGLIGDEAMLYDEVIVAAEELGAAIDRPIRYFAFPFGQKKNLNRKAFEMARRYGLAGVCSAYGGYNFPGDDPFHIQRFHGDEETARFRNWLTIDPRKLSSIERYDARAMSLYSDASVDSNPAAAPQTSARST